MDCLGKHCWRPVNHLMVRKLRPTWQHRSRLCTLRKSAKMNHVNEEFGQIFGREHNTDVAAENLTPSPPRCDNSHILKSGCRGLAPVQPPEQNWGPAWMLGDAWLPLGTPAFSNSGCVCASEVLLHRTQKRHCVLTSLCSWAALRCRHLKHKESFQVGISDGFVSLAGREALTL